MKPLRQMVQILERWLKLSGAWNLALVMVTGSIVFSLSLLWPAYALAATWYPVAETAQGQQQQLIDLDSIEPLSLGQVRVASLYLDRRSGTLQQTTYVTEYDCQKRRFRDLLYNGSKGSMKWFPADPDPLNAATMDYLCSLIPQ